MTTAAIQDQLTTVLLANPDVLTLYSVRPTVLEITSQTVRAVVKGEHQAPKVLVIDTDAGTTVEVSVGVTGEHSATAVCRDLHESITAELTAVNATLPLTIAVKISSIA
jgi:hypothetical protein